MVPKVRRADYIPFFGHRAQAQMEAALIQVVQEAFVQGVSTRKMEKPGPKPQGIENLPEVRSAR